MAKIEKEIKEEIKEVKKEEREIIKKIKKNPWIASTIILALIVLILLFFVSKNSAISEKAISQKVIDFAKARGAGDIQVIKINDKGSLYEIIILLNGEEAPIYATKDGKNLVPAIMPLEATPNAQIQQQQQQPQPAEIQKSDKPKIELFVMTHCPFGIQAEKGIIPTIKLLGSTIDAKIRFVHYFMHGDEEEKETYNQVCIREEQKEKFISYLECFLEDGNSSKCVDKTGTDKNKLTSCLNNKAKTYYAQDSALSEGYGVQGSPTLVINSVQAESGRSSSAFLTTICSAFNSQPDECKKQLSSANPSSGFGAIEDRAGHAAEESTCG